MCVAERRGGKADEKSPDEAHEYLTKKVCKTLRKSDVEANKKIRMVTHDNSR